MLVCKKKLRICIRIRIQLLYFTEIFINKRLFKLYLFVILLYFFWLVFIKAFLNDNTFDLNVIVKIVVLEVEIIVKMVMVLVVILVIIVGNKY